MVRLADFLVRVEEIANEGPKYRHGGDGKDGYCDCIGLIIGAIRRAGGSWRGLHGSNYAARYETENFAPIAAVADLHVGDAVFKAYEPGQGGYDLPVRYQYRNESYNGDLRDYYHVGVVISTSPLRIRHMTSPKAKVDTQLGKWGYHGKLKKLDGGTTMEPYKATVNTKDGGKLNLREQPSTSSGRIAQIPNGTELDIIDKYQDWRKTNYGSLTGWVDSSFLIEASGDGGETVLVPKKELEKLYDLIGDLLGLRG